MKLISSKFKHYESIPLNYTGEGEDISPPLSWEDVPKGVKSFALICEDPDAPHGTWDHWVLYNIPSSERRMEEGLTLFPAGTLRGKNSWGKLGYGGPYPPSGKHRYFFTLYALDAQLSLEEGASKSDLLKSMEGHILEDATLMGFYERQGEWGVES